MYTLGIITSSDKGSRGERYDKSGEVIKNITEKCGFKDYMFVDSFEEAVLTAAKIAESGEAVLLSPACASWDMFPSYEVRGEKFKEIVNSL